MSTPRQVRFDEGLSIGSQLTLHPNSRVTLSTAAPRGDVIECTAHHIIEIGGDKGWRNKFKCAGLNGPQIKTCVYHTRGPFWSSRPVPIMFWSAVGTKSLATAAAAWDIFMAPIGWHWALVIWAYCLAWFFVNEWTKLAAYRIFAADHSGLLTKVGLHPKLDWSGGFLRGPGH